MVRRELRRSGPKKLRSWNSTPSRSTCTSGPPVTLRRAHQLHIDAHLESLARPHVQAGIGDGALAAQRHFLGHHAQRHAVYAARAAIEQRRRHVQIERQRRAARRSARIPHGEGFHRQRRIVRQIDVDRPLRNRRVLRRADSPRPETRMLPSVFSCYSTYTFVIVTLPVSGSV